MRVYLDIETIAHESVTDDELLEGYAPPANYKDEAKIAAHRAQKLAEARSRLALDALTGRIICIGSAVDDSDPTAHSWAPKDGHHPQDVERGMLDNAMQWLDQKCRLRSPTICAFNVEFDAGFVWRRARILGVPLPSWWPRPIQITPWSDRLLDPMREWAGRGGTISQARLCRALGIDIPDDEIDGAGVGAAWEEGRHDDIVRHCMADVRRVRQISRALLL